MHVLDPKMAEQMSRSSKIDLAEQISRSNLPAPYGPHGPPNLGKQMSVDFSLLEVHEDSSAFNHRFNQATADRHKPRDRLNNRMTVIHLGFDQPDHGFSRKTPEVTRPETHTGHVMHGGAFPISQVSEIDKMCFEF